MKRRLFMIAALILLSVVLVAAFTLDTQPTNYYDKVHRPLAIAHPGGEDF